MAICIYSKLVWLGGRDETMTPGIPVRVSVRVAADRRWASRTKQERTSYFGVGLAVGQSRLLVEDPLRDGHGPQARALSREMILGQAWRPMRDRLPWARYVLRCEDWAVVMGWSL